MLPHQFKKYYKYTNKTLKMPLKTRRCCGCRRSFAHLICVNGRLMCSRCYGCQYRYEFLEEVGSYC